MASGKSTLAQHLAERLTRSVHLRGDVFRRMVVGGRAEMSSKSTAGALSQLQLRYQASFEAARLYSAAGFTVVYQDTIIGPALAEVVEFYRGHRLHVIVLSPRLNVVSQREQDRPKTGYTHFTVEALDEVMRSTPRIGVWIDNSDQSVEQTAHSVQQNMEAARIQWE
jgi:predicted kinase